MRVVVAAEGNTPEATVSSRAARAPFYLIFEEGQFVDAIKNPYVSLPGAGWRAAELVASLGADVFIAGSVGENMRRTLAARGIRVVESGRMSAEDAVERVR